MKKTAASSAPAPQKAETQGFALSCRTRAHHSRSRAASPEPKDLEALRNIYLHYGTTPGGVRPVVLESWKRCRRHGLRPDVLKPQVADPQRLANARTANRDLLSAADPVLGRIHEVLGSEPHIVAVTDRNGFVLRMLADPATMSADSTRASGLFEGASWHERDSGSNSVGTCLAVGRPLVLIGAEHFHTAFVNWTCIGLPIRAAQGEVVGALNVSVTTPTVRLELWGWTHSLASEIEAELSGQTSRPPPAPSTDADRAINALMGINELLLSQLNLPPTHARLIEEVGRAVVVTNAHRQQEEERLRRSEERFRILFTSISQGFELKEAVFDADGRITDFRFIECNPAFERMTGLKDVVGKTMREALPGIESTWIDAYASVVHTGNPLRFADRAATLDRWLEVFAWKLQGPEPHRIGVLVTDITARKNAEAALARAQKDLRQHAANLERMVDERTARLRETVTELEHFSYTVAHDLRAPLRAMNEFSRILLEEYAEGLPAEAKNLLERIGRAGSRMHALTTDLLSYTRLPVMARGTLVPVSIETALADLLEGDPRLVAQADLIIPSRLRPVLGHPALVQQILANLIANAVKYTAHGVRPRVIIRTEAVTVQSSEGELRPHHLQAMYRENQDEKVAVAAAQPGERAQGVRAEFPAVRLWVEDNGVGIAPEYHQKIFGLFEQLRPASNDSGTGIGLAIVARATERMGGRCGVISTPGDGSRFWVELAAAPETSPPDVANANFVLPDRRRANDDRRPVSSGQS